MPTASRRLTDLLIAWRIPLLILGLVLAAASFVLSRGLQYDRRVETLFAADDPRLISFLKLKRFFAGNEMVLAVYHDDHLLDPDGTGIRRLAKVSRALESVPGVMGVLSLDQPLRSEEQPLGERIVDPDSAQARRVRRLLQGYTHSADGKTVGIGCILVPEDKTDVARAVTVAGIRRVMQSQPMGMVAGEPVMVVDGFRYVEEDGRRLGWATTVLLGLVLVLTFRSVRWVIIAVAVVQLAILLTQATVVVLGLQMSMVSSVLTAIVTVIGIAAVMHIIVRVREERAAGRLPLQALAISGAVLAVPVFWSSATDAAGFCSLVAANVEPLQDFGIMMGMGAMYVLVAIVLIVPGLATIGPVDRGPRWAWGESYLDVALSRCADWSQRHPVPIAAVAGIVSGLAILGSAQLEIETDFTANFREDSEIVQSYRYVESHLGGAGVWDVIVPAPPAPDWNYFLRVRRLESRLLREVIVAGPDGREAPGILSTLSLPDAIIAGSPKNLQTVRYSHIRNTLLGAGLRILEREMPVLVALLRGQDPDTGQNYYRIMLRSLERQPAAQKHSIIDQASKIIREEFPPTANTPGAEAAGFFVLLTYLIDSILRDQWITFAVATVSMAIMISIAVRNLLFGLVALVPNVFPIFVVMGLMGWLGLKINMGAAMIAAASIGLSVDTSIHYLDSFRRARQAGGSLRSAFEEVHHTVGRAVVFSTLAWVLGFLVLVDSEFIPTVYFGVLVSITTLGGLLGSLVVLPVLLTLALRRKDEIAENDSRSHSKAAEAKAMSGPSDDLEDKPQAVVDADGKE
jgi:predicted RND superfamily exporter protein